MSVKRYAPTVRQYPSISGEIAMHAHMVLADDGDWVPYDHRMEALLLDNERLAGALEAFTQCERLDDNGKHLSWIIAGGDAAPMNLYRAMALARAALAAHRGRG